MNWIKKDVIFNSNNNFDWMQSFATVPFVDHINEDIFRIYFSSRDSNNHSHTSYVTIDIKNPKEILEISKKPVLSPGPLGSFDESGAMGSCLVNYMGKKYLYYIGWNQRSTIPYHNSIGLAISEDGGTTFKKISEGPMIDRNLTEPYFSASCDVMCDDEQWKIWYLSCKNWILHDGLPRPNYHIKYAESEDGINWKRQGTVAIDFKNKHEWAISRPCVIKENNLYKMWYSYSGALSYRIGYAESKDGRNWTRLDDSVGIDVSPNGWDSESIEYPFVFVHNDITYMLYCGNYFGKTGFGYAIME